MKIDNLSYNTLKNAKVRLINDLYNFDNDRILKKAGTEGIINWYIIQGYPHAGVTIGKRNYKVNFDNLELIV